MWRRIRNFRLQWHLVGLIILAALISIIETPVPLHQEPIEPITTKIGWEVLYSWLRMAIAFVGALIFAIVFGTLAATDKNRAKLILPVVDILQSVPLLGFFPTAIFWFMKIGPDRLGIELAVIFLIFTSQAWNLLFAVYDGIRLIPQSSLTAVQGAGIGSVGRFYRLYLPAAFPRIVENSPLSWANGWYFLMACEIIAMGPLSFEVPGLGAFMFHAVEQSSWISFYSGLGLLITIIILMDIFYWRPLGALANNFRFDQNELTKASSTTEEILYFYANSKWARPIQWTLSAFNRLFHYLEVFFGERVPEDQKIKTQKWKGITGSFNFVFWFFALVILLWSGWEVISVLLKPQVISAKDVCLSILASGARVLVAYLLCLAWILPLVFWLHTKAGKLAWVQSLSQVLASIPATAFYPVIAFLSLQFFHTTELAVILMLVTGMQWYLLFNVLGGAFRVGSQLQELGKSLGLSRMLYAKNIFLPAIAPALVTGSITAVGGGWNALIIAEYIQVAGETLSVFGIGSIISKATFELGDEGLVAYSLFFMVFFIVTMNRIFWQPLYEWAERRFKLDS